MTSLPERLRWAREIAGVSQRELGRLARLKSEMHVRLIEVSERPNLGIETVVALAGALGLSIDWLVRGDGEPPSEQTILDAIAAARAAVQPSEVAS